MFEPVPDLPESMPHLSAAGQPVLTPDNDSLNADIQRELARDPASPLAKLYFKSLQSPDQHFEGAACIPALHRIAEDLRGKGHVRCEPAEINERFSFMQDYAGLIFPNLRNVKAYINDFHPEQGKFDVPVLAVLFFGSYVRGKPEPGDIDARIVIPHGEPRLVDTFMMGFNEAQSAVAGKWAHSEEIPKHRLTAGKRLRISLEVDSHYGEGGGLEFVEKCPYLIFFRDRENGRIDMFMNTAGTEYLAGRAP
jgi:hypothetical protein